MHPVHISICHSVLMSDTVKMTPVDAGLYIFNTHVHTLVYNTVIIVITYSTLVNAIGFYKGESPETFSIQINMSRVAFYVSIHQLFKLLWWRREVRQYGII